eukprot:4014726-Pyramimonas_sp.AAC.1
MRRTKDQLIEKLIDMKKQYQELENKTATIKRRRSATSASTSTTSWSRPTRARRSRMQMARM